MDSGFKKEIRNLPLISSPMCNYVHVLFNEIERSTQFGAYSLLWTATAYRFGTPIHQLVDCSKIAEILSGYPRDAPCGCAPLNRMNISGILFHSILVTFISRSWQRLYGWRSGLVKPRASLLIVKRYGEQCFCRVYPSEQIRRTTRVKGLDWSGRATELVWFYANVNWSRATHINKTLHGGFQ